MNDPVTLDGSARTTAATEPSDPAEGGTERLWRTSVGTDASFLLARANALSLHRTNRVLGAFGLRARSYSLLSIAASDARPSQRELSEFLQLDPSQIVTLIDDLESRGLVRREADPRDRRAKAVVATERGHEVAADARNQLAGSDGDWFGRLPAEDRERVFELLLSLARSES